VALPHPFTHLPTLGFVGYRQAPASDKVAPPPPSGGPMNGNRDRDHASSPPAIAVSATPVQQPVPRRPGSEGTWKRGVVRGHGGKEEEEEEEDGANATMTMIVRRCSRLLCLPW
jgi:hypothetical protein